MRNLVLFLLLVPLARAQVLDRIIPTSEVVRIASMAARDEGYSVGVNGTYLNELRTPEGKEPIPRYTSIALYRDGHLVRSYAIRIETGDIVDPSVCKVFRYPDLIGFKKKIMNEFHTKDVPLEVIESEVGCDTLRVAPPSGKHAADGPS